MTHLLAGLGVVILLAVLLLTDAGEIRRRLRQGGHLIAEAGPWLVSAALHPWALRGRRMPPAQKAAATPSHPSVRPPGLPSDGRPLDDYEQRALDSLELRARVPQQGEGR